MGSNRRVDATGVQTPLESAPETLYISNITQIPHVEISRNDSPFTGKDLPILINGRKIRAQHDTGAEGGNFISQDLAFELGLRIQNENDNCKSFSIANGKVVQAIGSVKASCAFAKEPQTKIDCWFHVFKKLASSLIMGSQFLQETKTMSVFTNRLENRHARSKTIPMLNSIASTQQPRRRLAAFVDGRSTYINADSGSQLDFMSLAYVEKHLYEIDRRANCRKAIQLADKTIVLSTGQVTAQVTLENGSSYWKTFNVLKGLTSEVLLGESSLEEAEAFTALESSFVTVLVVERYFGLNVLVNLGKVTEFLANRFSRRRKPQPQPQPSLAKQQDDAMMEDLLAEDLEAERSRQQTRGGAAIAAVHQGVPQIERPQGLGLTTQGHMREPQHLAAPPIPPRSVRRG